VLTYGSVVKELSGSVIATKSNRIELMAVLEGLSAITKPCPVTIVTDSQNVIGWLSRGWKRKDPAINTLCAAIEVLIKAKGLTVSFEKVKGHAGHPMNERADQLAREAIPEPEPRATDEYRSMRVWESRDPGERL